MFWFIVRYIRLHGVTPFVTRLSREFQKSGSTGASSILTMTDPFAHARTTVPWGSGFSMMAKQASTTTSLLK